MRFKLGKGFNVCEVAAGQRLYRLDESTPELTTWEFDAIAALRQSPGCVEVDEKADDVLKALKSLSDREVKAVISFDGRAAVADAARDELARRHEQAVAAIAAPASADEGSDS